MLLDLTSSEREEQEEDPSSSFMSLRRSLIVRLPIDEGSTKRRELERLLISLESVSLSIPIPSR